MTIRLSQLGGTDWSDGEVLYSADLNNTGNAIVNKLEWDYIGTYEVTTRLNEIDLSSYNYTKYKLYIEIENIGSTSFAGLGITLMPFYNGSMTYFEREWLDYAYSSGGTAENNQQTLIKDWAAEPGDMFYGEYIINTLKVDHATIFGMGSLNYNTGSSYILRNGFIEDTKTKTTLSAIKLDTAASDGNFRSKIIIYGHR